MSDYQMFEVQVSQVEPLTDFRAYIPAAARIPD